MNIITKELSPLIQSLKQSFDNKDWDQIKEQDQALKMKVQELVNRDLNDSERNQLQTTLKALTRIYDVLLDSANKNKDEIGAELKKLNQDHKAVNKYIDSSRL